MLALTHYSARQFLFFLVVLFLVSPWIEDTKDPRLVWSILMTLVLVAASLAAGDRLSTRTLALAAATPAIAFVWLQRFHPDRISLAFSHSLVWLFAAWVSLRLFRHVLRAKKIDGEILSAAAATYLMAALAWGLAYMVVWEADPRAFSFATGPPAGQSMKGFTALYFSLTTISTVGYGDIMPSSRLARVLAMAEAVGGMFYMTMLIARLVSVYSSVKSTENVGE
jgi:voltage-gated potassium channel